MEIDSITESLTNFAAYVVFQEVFEKETIDVVHDAIGDMADFFLAEQRVVDPEPNPLIELVHQLSHDICHDMLVPLVKEAISAEVDIYLKDRKYVSMVDFIINDCLISPCRMRDRSSGETTGGLSGSNFGQVSQANLVEVSRSAFVPPMDTTTASIWDVVEECIFECKLEIVSESLFDEYVTDTTGIIAGQLLSEEAELRQTQVEQLNLQIISERSQSIIIQRLLLGHMISAVSNNFENVVVQHFARGLQYVAIAQRLVGIVDKTEINIENGKKDAVLRLLLDASAQPALKTLLIKSSIGCSNKMLDYIDAQESLGEEES